MPPPKIIGQVLQKKILWKKFKEEKRRKNNVAKEKKTLFCLKFWLLTQQGIPLRIPWGPKKEQSHLPCQVQTCPTGATTLWKKEKTYLQQVHVVKALLLTYSNPPRGARNNWRKFVFLLKSSVQKISVYYYHELVCQKTYNC